MYYVHKIIGWCLSPFGILFLGLGLAWALRSVRRGETSPRARVWKRLGTGMAALALVLTWILGCGYTTRFLGAPLEGEETDVCRQPAEAFGKIDAVVLLGGGMGVHERCGRAEMFSGADRAWTAARLWRKLTAARGDADGVMSLPITVSGGGAGGEIALLGDLGVSTNAILKLEAARNTEEESRLIREKLGEGKGKGQGQGEVHGQERDRILLVTSAWHMPRAKMLFERAGFDVVAAPTDYEMHYAAERPLEIGDFFPSGEALSRNGYALKEWVARLCYAIRK